MAKKMLIDAAHPEETRVVVLEGQRVDDFDFEIQNKKQLRGNIYLAKVTRVEPSLQAAFVEYGGNRHGFLAFSEIHPDYYQIPTADREALKAEVEAATAAEAAADGEAGEGDDDDGEAADELRRRILTRRYKIQEVIRRRQVMLIQVVKEERGSKGAALTTYLSLAGRYCVLMPNTARGGGISRKITNGPDRKRLKKIAADLDVPTGMGLIIRTAGAKRTKTEIKRDYEYLIRAWETIRDTTMRSVAPTLIYEESSLVKRSIRDLYDKDVEEIHVEGEAAYREAKDFVRMLMPSHAKRVHQWKEPAPILTKFGAERQLASAFSPVVNLRSGGYIVINQTEALVAIDVNSGRATRERNIEQTALKTNLEAAEEAARQIRLRDLAGLIVIDFIDMEEAKNDRAVEKRMKDCLRFDRARIQMGKISGFGLLELSRQRRRTGILEGSSHICPHCAGSGRVRSTESSALSLLRGLEEAAGKHSGAEITVRASGEVAFYVLNDKRTFLETLEQSRQVRIRVEAAPGLSPPDFEIETTTPGAVDDLDLAEDGPPPPRRARPPAAASRQREEPVFEAETPEREVEGFETEADNGDSGESSRRRRRGRRGGRRARDGAEGGVDVAAVAPKPRPESAPANGKRRRRRGRGRTGLELDGGEHLDFLASDPIAPAFAEAQEAEPELEAAAFSDAATPDSIAAEAPEPTPELAVEGDAPAPAKPERVRQPRAARPRPEEPVAQAREPMPAPAVEPEPSIVDAQEPPAPLVAPAQLEAEAYQPDQARRERFFSRLSRWGKKDM